MTIRQKALLASCGLSVDTWREAYEIQMRDDWLDDLELWLLFVCVLIEHKQSDNEGHWQ